MALFDGLANSIAGVKNNTSTPQPKSNGLFSGVADSIIQQQKPQTTPPPIQNTQPIPPTQKQNPLQIAGGVLTKAWQDFKDTGATLLNSLDPAKTSTADYLHANLNSGLSLMGLAFSPVNAITQGAASINPNGGSPVERVIAGSSPLPSIAKLANTGFAASKAVSDVPVNAIFDKLPQTPEVQKWREPSKGVANLVLLFAADAGAKGVSDFRSNTANMNTIVDASAKVLDVPVDRNVVGRANVDPQIVNERYRSLSHEVHPDKGGTPQAFQAVNTARNVLIDYTNLSTDAFMKKYKTPLEGLNVVLKSLPETTKQTPIEVPQTPPQETAIAPQIEQPSIQPIEQPKDISNATIDETAKIRGEGLNLQTSGKMFEEKQKIIPQPKLPKIIDEKSLIDAYINSKDGAEMQMKLEADRQALEQQRSNLSSDVTSAIKNSEYYRKEKSVSDEMASGWMMENANGRKVIVPASDVEKYVAKGYAPTTEVDTLAQEAGYEDAKDFLDAHIAEQQKVPTIKEAAKAAIANGWQPPIEPKMSKVGKSIEAKTIEKGLTDSFQGTAQYNPVTIKDQSEKVAALMSEDIDRAKRIVKGEEPLPDGLLGGTMIKAMEDHALQTGDAQLALDIANSPLTSETSIHAQEMRTLAERNPDSAVANIKRLQKIKDETARSKATKEKVVKDIKETVKKEVAKRATKQSWKDFIDSIEC